MPFVPTVERGHATRNASRGAFTSMRVASHLVDWSKAGQSYVDLPGKAGGHPFISPSDLA